MAHETPADLRELERLIETSHASAGSHLRSIFTDERRVPAERLPELLTGVQVLHLATVTAACEPRVAPVDGLFFRARLWFGSSHRSRRFAHIRARPAVSATITRGEELAVVVHGRAAEVDFSAPEGAAFREYCLEVYGAGWENWGAEAAYARIDAERMFTFATG